MGSKKCENCEWGKWSDTHCWVGRKGNRIGVTSFERPIVGVIHGGGTVRNYAYRCDYYKRKWWKVWVK